jgi:hypothetical protein
MLSSHHHPGESIAGDFGKAYAIVKIPGADQPLI